MNPVVENLFSALMDADFQFHVPAFHVGYVLEHRETRWMGVVIGMKMSTAGGWEYLVWYPEQKILGAWEEQKYFMQQEFVEQAPSFNLELLPDLKSVVAA